MTGAAAAAGGNRADGQGLTAPPAHGARPVLARGRLVTVDGHPICAVCGTAVVPAAPPRWEHVPAGRRFPRRSAWFAPVTWPELAGLATYREFVARYPWTVRPELCGGVITSEADWLEGVRRLRDYHGGLTVARRRRVLRAGQNPYLELARGLAGQPPDSASRDSASQDWAGRDRASRDRVSQDRAGRSLSWSVPGGLGSVLNLPARRRELAALFAWAIPADGALALLAEYAPLVECGAGTGYWAALLRARGIDVSVSDLAPGHRSWTGVSAAHAVAAVRANRGRTLLLCWPPYDDDGASYAALRAYRGDVVLYVGGGPGGPTGTIRFHRELKLNWSMARQLAVPNWPGLRDRLIVYQRNAVRRPLADRDRCDDCRRFLPTGTIGRCDACFARHPPAMALRINGQRVEYPREVVNAMPPGLRMAFERSPALIRLQ